jgi:hypothetical protein
MTQSNDFPIKLNLTQIKMCTFSAGEVQQQPLPTKEQLARMREILDSFYRPLDLEKGIK